MILLSQIVTLAEPDATNSSAASPRGSLASSLDTLSISAASTSSSTTTFDPPQSVSSKESTTPRGILTLLDRSGAPRALINAEEITAFRTALASTMLFKKRANVHDLVRSLNIYK